MAIVPYTPKSLTNRVGSAARRDLAAQQLMEHITPGATSACWPWTGPTNELGKGIFCFTEEGKNHNFLAHRVVYELLVGPIGAGCPVRQTCGNPLCCNPAHLVAERPPDSIWSLIVDVNATFWADVEEFCLGMQDANKAAKTITTYKGVLRDLTLWLATAYPDVKAIVDLQRVHTKAYNRTLQGRAIAPRSRAKYLAVIRSMLKHFTVETDLPVMSRDRVGMPKLPQYLPKTFATADQVQMLVDGCDRSTTGGRRDAAILALLFASGLRVAELVSLDRRSIPVGVLGTVEVLSVRVVRKGGDIGAVPIGADAQLLLREYLTDRADAHPALFVGLRVGNPRYPSSTETGRLTTRGVQMMLKKRVRAAGLPDDLTPHSLRHGLATDLIENGAGMREIQQVLGHKHITTTEIYTHLSPKSYTTAYLKRTQISLDGPRALQAGEEDKASG